MSTGDFLNIHPSEIKFPFELRRQNSCSLQLTNKTSEYVAFKVKTTNPKKYCVRPNSGIISPGSSSNFTVTMQASKEAPPNMQCKDKFLLQSVIAPNGATNKDISPELFSKEDGKVVEEFRLRAVYILANLPSPVPKGSEEGSSPRAYHVEGGNQNATSLDALPGSLEEPKEKPASAEEWSMVSRLTDEKASAIEQNQKLRQEWDGFLFNEDHERTSTFFDFDVETKLEDATFLRNRIGEFKLMQTECIENILFMKHIYGDDRFFDQFKAMFLKVIEDGGNMLRNFRMDDIRCTTDVPTSVAKKNIRRRLVMGGNN